MNLNSCICQDRIVVLNICFYLSMYHIGELREDFSRKILLAIYINTIIFWKCYIFHHWYPCHSSPGIACFCTLSACYKYITLSNSWFWLNRYTMRGRRNLQGEFSILNDISRDILFEIDIHVLVTKIWSEGMCFM